MVTIKLYETNSDPVFLQKDDGPVWDLTSGGVTPDLEGRFAADAAAWAAGDWEPCENDGQTVVESPVFAGQREQGLALAATWTEDGGVVQVADSLGAGAETYIGGE